MEINIYDIIRLRGQPIMPYTFMHIKTNSEVIGCHCLDLINILYFPPFKAWHLRTKGSAINEEVNFFLNNLYFIIQKVYRIYIMTY